MKELRPTLWRTCRIIANETRLQLLWHLFTDGELCVTQLSRKVNVGQPTASNQLRALSARGLITPRREKKNVIYRAEANNGVDFAPEQLEALRKCHEQSMSLKTVIRQATAFTHERRIEIVRALNSKILPFYELRGITGMSPAALSRHLEKLEARRFIKKTDGLYRIVCPGNPLGRTLIEIARY
ncbi:MAG: winged helix-turn-helix transcriptional regulator [Verrucomicrobia bacterium]|nr:winged helix-turn-helix transcriptional regulator [Verrucomicrobiota bacterium]